MLWEKKIQLKEEARSEFEKQNEEVQKLKMEVQNKEVISGLVWFLYMRIETNLEIGDVKTQFWRPKSS